jgi:uncharacterized OB-fold protein
VTARKRVRPAEVAQRVEQPREFLGPHRLNDAEFRTAVGAVDFAVDARYAWDTGVAVSRYLRGLKQGQILARKCPQCRRVLVPPRMFCEQCFRPTDRWIEVEDTGVVNTFSLCYVSWDMRPLEIPEIPAVIEIDGASSGIGFMHKLGEVDPDQVHVGMAVEAVWKPEGEREGSILDIRYFRPREAALRQKTTPSSAEAGRSAASRKRKR